MNYKDLSIMTKVICDNIFVTLPGTHLDTYCGSPEYAAPELYTKETYDQKV